MNGWVVIKYHHEPLGFTHRLINTCCALVQPTRSKEPAVIRVHYYIKDPVASYTKVHRSAHSVLDTAPRSGVRLACDATPLRSSAVALMRTTMCLGMKPHSQGQICGQSKELAVV
jgi:hypothetical protein